MKVIDCHTHPNFDSPKLKMLLSRYDFEPTIRDLEAEMADLEVEKIIAIAGTSQASNRAMEKLANSNDNIYWAYGCTPEKTVLSDLYNISPKKLAAFKLYPGYQDFYPNDKRLQNLYAFASDLKKPVIFHSGDPWDRHGKMKYSMPIHIDDVAVDNPDTTFVIAHIGNPFIREAAAVANKNPNVFVDFSGMTDIMFHEKNTKYARRVAEDVQWTIDFLGETEKLMYGSDWPLIKMRPYFEIFNSLNISKQDREQMFYSNAKRVFKI